MERRRILREWETILAGDVILVSNKTIPVPYNLVGKPAKLAGIVWRMG